MAGCFLKTHINDIKKKSKLLCVNSLDLLHPQQHLDTKNHITDK